MATEIKVPHLGANDTVATLVAWKVSDGQEVKVGDDLCLLETTKTTFDLASEVDGVIKIKKQVGSECGIQEVIAWIGSSREELDLVVPPIGDQPAAAVQVKATEKAIRLAEKLGIDLSQMRQEGLIREKDVYAYYEAWGKMNKSLDQEREG